MCRRHPWYRVLIPLASFALIASAQASDVEKRLRDEYGGKKFFIRNFYAGDRLHYDSFGNEIGSAPAGDWIADGLVSVRDIHLSHRHLTIDAERLLIVELHEKEFQIQSEKEKELPKLKIESNLDDESQADALLAKIFLTGKDSLAGAVVDYWKPCVRQAAAGGPLQFSPDMLAIPGVAQSSKESNDPPTATTDLLCTTKWTYKKGDSRPRLIHNVEPQFPQGVRSAHLQGSVGLKLVVDEKGKPEFIRVTRPLGHGFDQQAIIAMKQWVFAPAEKDGQPIPTELTVEVNFHLY